MFDFIKKLFGGNKTELIQTALKNGAIIIDVRSTGEFAGGHIKGAKNIPLPNIAKEAVTIKKANKPVIVCCASGMRSAQAKSFLTSKGVEAYNGGSWQSLQNIINYA
ncbi:MAG TPA: rhodanese-like domain-containing protein [Bacteroidia bacterium]|jgi:phage shock protein E|nr:rhodanese-like domain-containing protein [Bacteroidia bacterium]